MPKTCPSSPFDLAENVLAILGSDGSLRYLPFKIDKFSSEDPQITRYTTKCITKNCSHWVSGHCDWTDHLSSLTIPNQVEPTITCNVRTECRWYHQIGLDACKYCPYIINGAFQLNCTVDS